MDTNTTGKFKPKPPPKPLFISKENSQLNRIPKCYVVKPPLLPKPPHLLKPKLLNNISGDDSSISSSSNNKFPSLLPTGSFKFLDSTIEFESSKIKMTDDSKKETISETNSYQCIVHYSKHVYHSESHEKDPGCENGPLVSENLEDEINLVQHQNLCDNKIGSTVHNNNKGENESIVFSLGNSSLEVKNAYEENDIIEESKIKTTIDDCNTLCSSQMIFCNSILEMKNADEENDIIEESKDKTTVDHCDTICSPQTSLGGSSLEIKNSNEENLIIEKSKINTTVNSCNTICTQQTSLSGSNLEMKNTDEENIVIEESKIKTTINQVTICDTQTSVDCCYDFNQLNSDKINISKAGSEIADSDSQSSDSSCASFSAISDNSFNVFNPIVTTEGIHKRHSLQTPAEFSTNVFTVKNGIASAIGTSTPILTGGISVCSNKHKNEKDASTDDIIDDESDNESPYIEEKNNSLDNNSSDNYGSGSVRRRLSTWFGSFGKGNKQKEKRESLFYYDTDNLAVDSCEGVISKTNEEGANDQYLDLPSPNQNESNRSSLDYQDCLSNEQMVEVTNRIPTDKKEFKAYKVACELMTSEKVFIDVLKLLCQDFKDFVKSYNGELRSPVVTDEEFNKIIASLPELMKLSEELYQNLDRRIQSWHDWPKMSDIFVKTGPFLKLFSFYIQNFESQCCFLDDLCNKYHRFDKAVKEFENSDACRNLKIKHYMLKPVQRIPQYRLLLSEYLSHLNEESIDYRDTVEALKIVSNVANHANVSLSNDANLSKLVQLQTQLGYEIIKPSRKFILDGVLQKLSRKENQSRYFILLSDCLLYTSYYGSMTGLKVKYELRLSGMKVNVPQKEDNAEFSIITSTKSFTLRAESEEECNRWVVALQNAIKENNNRQLTFVSVNLADKTTPAETIKLGKEAPVWIQDQRVTMCQICTAVFTVTFRRHHCRACGRVICGNCSENKAPLQYRKFESAKVCDKCHEHLLLEFNDVTSNMYDVIKQEFNLNDDEDIKNKMEVIRSLFKKKSSAKKHPTKSSFHRVPSRLKEVSAKDSRSKIAGWLYKKDRRSWKMLWFVLKEQVLYVYKAPEDIAAVDSIPILGYQIEYVDDGMYDDEDLDKVFQLSHANQNPLVFGTNNKTKSASRWYSAFEEAIVLK